MFNYSTREEIGASISVERKRNTRATTFFVKSTFRHDVSSIQDSAELSSEGNFVSAARQVREKGQSSRYYSPEEDIPK